MYDIMRNKKETFVYCTIIKYYNMPFRLHYPEGVGRAEL